MAGVIFNVGPTHIARISTLSLMCGGSKIEIHQNLRNSVSILIKIHPLQQNQLIWNENYLS